MLSTFSFNTDSSVLLPFISQNPLIPSSYLSYAANQTACPARASQITMPPRSFPAIVPDSCIIELFTTPRTLLKAHRVLLLLGLPRSKIRNIQSALRRLVKQGALIELSPLSSAQRHPLYARSPNIHFRTSSIGSSSADALDGIQATPVKNKAHAPCVAMAPATPSDCNPNPDPVTVVQSQCAVLPADISAAAEDGATTRQPTCVVCRESWPTEVLLPCRHQACCQTCWVGWGVRERSVHNRRERLRRELGARGVVRAVFRPRCPICMDVVEQVISPYTNI